MFYYSWHTEFPQKYYSLLKKYTLGKKGIYERITLILINNLPEKISSSVPDSFRFPIVFFSDLKFRKKVM